MTTSESSLSNLEHGTTNPQCLCVPIYQPLPQDPAAREEHLRLLHPFLKAVSRFPEVREEILQAVRRELGV